MDYDAFRQFSDSWGLVYLMIVFVAVVLYAFRPGGKKTYEKVARIPLEED